MHFSKMGGLLAMCAGLLGCAAIDGADPYGRSPEEFGLVSVGPFPGPEDVCRVIGESERTLDYLDHTFTLVGCPVSETGAISDRLAEGGDLLELVADAWWLISVPTG